jgi:hypothetical protein
VSTGRLSSREAERPTRFTVSVADTKAGQTVGEGSKAFGAAWYALAPSGSTIDRD